MDSFLDEGRKVESVTGGNELNGLSDEREAHGARRKDSIAFRISPPVNQVGQTYNHHGGDG